MVFIDRSDRFLVVVGTAPVHFSMQGLEESKFFSSAKLSMLYSRSLAVDRSFSSLPSGLRKLDMKENRKSTGIPFLSQDQGLFVSHSSSVSI